MRFFIALILSAFAITANSAQAPIDGASTLEYGTPWNYTDFGSVHLLESAQTQNLGPGVYEHTFKILPAADFSGDFWIAAMGYGQFGEANPQQDLKFQVTWIFEQESTGQVIEPTLLPTFRGATLDMHDWSGGNVIARLKMIVAPGEIQRVYIAYGVGVVPEPSTYLLLSAALTACVLIRRRHS